MKKLVAVFIVAGLAVACGDDVKKSSDNSSANNTSANNTSANNTSANNGMSGNNTSANNGMSGNNTSPNNPSANNVMSGNNTSGDDFDLGPDDTQLSDLTLEEVQEDCRVTTRYFDTTSKTENCVLTGYFSAAFELGAETDEELQMGCADVRDECLTTPVDTSDCLEETTMDCDATVGQLETCLIAFDVAFKAALSGFTCETASLEVEPNLDVIYALPPACQVIEDACPGYFN